MGRTTGATGASLDLSQLSPRLSKNDAGIWVAEGADRLDLSFPDDGHETCFGVEDDSFWFRHRNECLLAAITRSSCEGPLLDVGGGNGAVSRAIETLGLSTVVVEPGAEGAANARKRGLANVARTTLEGAAFRPGSFGAAGAFDVIEHVRDEGALLREVHRVLRPGGALFVTVPAYDWLWSAEDDLAGHFRRYTLPRLREVLEACAFEVSYETYFFAPLVVPIFLLRNLRYRLGARSGAGRAESAARDHHPSPTTRSALALALAPELAAIRRGVMIPFGASCLAVATKRSSGP
jgi:SAM-dependent methyltransferase